MQVILFKGFNMLTNMAYEVAVPNRASEMLLAIFAQNVKVIVDAYILGTLFHYLVFQARPASHTAPQPEPVLRCTCQLCDRCVEALPCGALC